MSSSNGKGRSKVCLLAGSRTPIGSYGKSLGKVPVDALAGHAMTSAMRRAGLTANQIDGIIMGHGYQSSYTPNTARFAALKAGISAQVPAMTVQRQCGSGMEAVNLASKDIMLGDGEIYLAGGCESMSTVPYMLPAALRREGPIAKHISVGWPRPIVAKLADDGLMPVALVMDTKSLYMMGTAQRLADTYNISRQEQDEYALRSQKLAVAARDSGRFDIEIDPFPVPKRSFFNRDEHPRANTTLEKLSTLEPRLKTKDITAGNSSGINDGACVLVLASEQAAERLGKKPLAYLVDSAVVGVDPDQMGLGPVAAIEKLLQKNQLSLKDIDLFEINEAFAAQYLACEKLLGLDREKVNVNGGAIALGHPIGMSGARLILTLAYELKKRGLKRGIAALCIGGGMGIATLVEANDD